MWHVAKALIAEALLQLFFCILFIFTLTGIICVCVRLLERVAAAFLLPKIVINSTAWWIDCFVELSDTDNTWS